MKRLIIDAQLFQTPAWHRGMGKYSFEFIKSLSRRNQTDPQWSGISIVLSKNGPLDQQMVDEVTAIAGVELHLIDVLLNGAEGVVEHNRTVIDAFVEMVRTPQEQIDFIITSLMQNEICPVFPSGAFVNKAVIFYDLIPLTFHKTYLQDKTARHKYLSKMPELLRADKYLAISKTVANDLTTYLGVAPHRVATIDGGAIDHNDTVESMAVKKPFILMPTGNDLRKNNRRGIEGFAAFNKKHGDAYTLVITSFFTDDEIRTLSSIAPNIYFTGNISGAKLKYLYQEAAAVLFPSEYEGLGLPVLEALKENTSVACSDISVFREISKDAFALFDPKNTAEITDALEKAIGTKPDAKTIKKILDKYNWDVTAELAQKILQRKHTSLSGDISRLAIAAADPTAASRVSKLVLQAHGELARMIKLSYSYNGTYTGNEQRVDFLPYISTVNYFWRNQSIRVPAALSLYHLENTPESSYVAFMALARPGILVLHDSDMRRVWESMHAEGLVSEQRLGLERALDEKYGGGNWLVSLVQNQKAIIVFSPFAKQRVELLLRGAGRKVPVYLLDIPVNVLAYDDVLPEKTATVLTVSDITTLDDMVYEDALSKTAGIFINDASTDSLVVAVEAAKYGANLFAAPGSNAGITNVQERTYEQALHDVRKEPYNKESETEKMHDYEDFAKSITKIVKEIEEKEV